MIARLSLLELADLYLQSLFLFDHRGRCRAVNEPGEPRPPRLTVTRTTEGTRWATRDDVPDAIAKRIDALIGDGPAHEDLEARPPYTAAVREALGEHAPVADEGSGPCFAIESLGPQPAGPVVRIEGAERDLLAGFPGWDLQDATELDESQPCFGVVDGDRAASICFSSRRPLAAVEAGGETLDGHRRRGYATRVVYAWAAELLRQGRVPLYSTSWDNAASRAVASRLRMRFYGASWSLV